MLKFLKKLWKTSRKTEVEERIDANSREVKAIQAYIELVDKLHSSMVKTLSKRLEATEDSYGQNANIEDWVKKGLMKRFKNP